MGISVWTTCPESLCAPTGSRTFHLLIAITTTKQSLYGIKSYTQNAIPDSQPTVSIALNGTQNNGSNYTENLFSTGPPPVLIIMQLQRKGTPLRLCGRFAVMCPHSSRTSPWPRWSSRTGAITLALNSRTWHTGLVLVLDNDRRSWPWPYQIIVVIYGNMAQKIMKLYWCLVKMYNIDDLS